MADEKTQNPAALSGGAASLTQGGFNAIGQPEAWSTGDVMQNVPGTFDWDVPTNLYESNSLTTQVGADQMNAEFAQSVSQGGGGLGISPGVAGAVGSIAQSLGSMASTYFQAKAAKKVAAAQERIERANQQVAELAAHMALQRSAWNIGQLSMRAARIKAGQKTHQGASGTRIGVGSNAEVLASTDIMKEIDINQEYVNGYREAWNVRLNGVQAGMRATAAGAYGASISPIGSSLMVGASGLLKTYKEYSKELS
jgi:hypothetical protein